MLPIAIYGFTGLLILIVGWFVTQDDIRRSELNPGEGDEFSWSLTALDDASGALGPDEVLSTANLKRLRPVSELDLYNSKVARWFVLRIDNPQKLPLAVNIKKSSYFSLEIYERLSAPGSGFWKAFDFVERTWRDLFTPHYTYFLNDTNETGTRTMLVRITAATRLILPVTVMRRDHAAANMAMVSMALGAYYGSIIVMLFYNAFLYFFIGDIVYLIYVVYLAAFSLTQMSVDGFLPVIFHYYNQIWTGHLGIVFGLLTVIFLTYYTRYFLVLPRKFPRLDAIAIGSIAVFTVALILSPVISYAVGLKIVYFSNFVCALILLVLGFGSYLGGYKPARYFILGNMLLITASMLMALMLLGVVSHTVFDPQAVDYLIKLGSALEVVFFSFALADRINIMAIEHERNQQSLHEAALSRLESEKQIARETAKANQYMVLAQMTQTLAHDIRKPFSMLKIALDRVAALADDPRDLKAVVSKIRFHVGKAFEDVNHMIGDIMEASAGPAKLDLTPRSLRAVTAAALNQTFRYHQNAQVEFVVRMQHLNLCEFEEPKILRVLVNILDNARQAMGGKGRIEISTRDLTVAGVPMVQLTILNTNSYIAGDDLEQIFEPFFTKNKKGGTGLGLAICRKIIEAHGGEIRCSSSAERGTEFAMTIPALNERDEDVEVWPLNSQMIYREFESTLLGGSSTVLGDVALQNRKQISLARMVKNGRPFKVLIIDDEQIYAEGIRNLVKGENELRIEFVYVDNPSQAFIKADAIGFDLIICDIDFPGSDVSGFEIISRLRQYDKTTMICIHSNRVLPADYRRAIEAGADAFLPKPMTYPHLIGLLVGDRVADAGA